MLGKTPRLVAVHRVALSEFTRGINPALAFAAIPMPSTIDIYPTDSAPRTP